KPLAFAGARGAAQMLAAPSVLWLGRVRPRHRCSSVRNMQVAKWRKWRRRMRSAIGRSGWSARGYARETAATGRSGGEATVRGGGGQRGRWRTVASRERGVVETAAVRYRQAAINEIVPACSHPVSEHGV